MIKYENYQKHVYVRMHSASRRPACSNVPRQLVVTTKSMSISSSTLSRSTVDAGCSAAIVNPLKYPLPRLAKTVRLNNSPW